MTDGDQSSWPKVRSGATATQTSKLCGLIKSLKLAPCPICTWTLPPVTFWKGAFGKKRKRKFHLQLHSPLFVWGPLDSSEVKLQPKDSTRFIDGLHHWLCGSYKEGIRRQGYNKCHFLPTLLGNLMQLPQYTDSHRTCGCCFHPTAKVRCRVRGWWRFLTLGWKRSKNESSKLTQMTA